MERVEGQERFCDFSAGMRVCTDRSRGKDAGLLSRVSFFHRPVAGFAAVFTCARGFVRLRASW